MHLVRGSTEDEFATTDAVGQSAFSWTAIDHALSRKTVIRLSGLLPAS
jgi:hypothetical protein